MTSRRPPTPRRGQGGGRQRRAETEPSHYARHKQGDPDSIKDGTTLLEAQPGQRTSRLAHFSSGVKRKASFAEQLRQRRLQLGMGLVVHKINVFVGTSCFGLRMGKFARSEPNKEVP